MTRPKQNKGERPTPGARIRYLYATKKLVQSGLTARDGNAPQRVRRLEHKGAGPSEQLRAAMDRALEIDLAAHRGPSARRDGSSMGERTKGYVEQAVYDSELAARLKAVRLAQAGRADDWAAQWLAIEEEYEGRCKLACSLLGEGVEDVALHDGHVAELVLTARAFLDRGAELFARAPWVRHLHVKRYREVGSSLFGSPLLRGIQSLGLLGEGLEDDDIEELVKSPHIDGLRWLDLSYNKLGERSFAQLATCPALAHLEYLGLEGNASESPVDRMGTDPLDGAVVSTTRTPTGRALEALAGELKWLHAPARYPYSYPPSPLDVAKAP